MKKRQCMIGIAALTALSLTTVTPAAVISWGDATAVSTVADISTSGTLVEAINFSALDAVPGSVTASGVTFTNNGSMIGKDNNGDFYLGSTGDADYDQLLSDLDYGGLSGLITLSLGGGSLTSGFSYEIQIWYSDNDPTRTMQYGDGNGNTVDLLNNGQFVIGTFTADGTSQALTLDPLGFGQSHINACQVRKSIPEPSSAALLLGLCGFALTLRRRRR
jgi:hypothetical protein